MKNMKLIKAIIEKGKDNLYSVYLPDIAGIFGTGETETEAIENLKEAIETALEHVEETGDYAYYAPLLENHKLEFVYDLSGFFKTYNYFDVTAFSKRIGINASLMRRYKTGISKASVSQKTRILSGIHTVANELQLVNF
jgi:predicted RNase H-like HicB family nuclease